ncbi:O-antigen ligase family protein [Candidatus Pelagibacter sp.]|nr:O-antigen ligase family protein [Candidatus Pelagibacter sp.]
MILNKYLYNYFLVLFSLIPLSIIIGSAFSLFNIILIDLSFIVLLIYIGDYSFLKKKTVLYFFILYAYLIFNSLISLDFYSGVYRNFGFLRIIIFFIAFNYFFNQSFFFKKMIKSWLIVFLIVLIDVIIEFLFGRNLLGYGKVYGERIVSFFKDEPIVGGYLNGFYLLIIGFLLKEYRNKKNYLIILFSILFLSVIILTGERSNSLRAFFGFIVFFMFYDEFKIKKKLFLLSSTIILIFLILINSTYLKIRFHGQIKTAFNQESTYLKLFDSGFEVFKNHKIFGVGNKNYRIETCGLTNKNNNKKKKKYYCSTHPHQVYIEFLSEHGLVGSIIFFLILYKLIFSKIRDTITDKNINYLKLGSLVYMLLVFTPVIPGGAFFNDYMLTIFSINLSIFYASDKKMNIFTKN